MQLLYDIDYNSKHAYVVLVMPFHLLFTFHSQLLLISVFLSRP